MTNSPNPPALPTNNRIHRYWLERTIDDDNPATVAFIMLNPSTATDITDDPTVRRCKGFAKAWGYGRLIIVNLATYRTPHPAGLITAASAGTAIFRSARTAIACAHREADELVAAWGANVDRVPAAAGIARWAVDHCQPISRIGSPTRDGHPRHPLYLAGTTPRENHTYPDMDKDTA